MPLVGTQEGEFKYPNDPFMKASSSGQRLFQRLELLHPCQIKQYMGKPHKQLEELRRKWDAVERSQLSATTMNDPEDSEDSEEDEAAADFEDDNDETGMD
jgi:hypothetical protein